LKVRTEHVCRYSTETITIHAQANQAPHSKKNVHTMNYLVGLTVLIPLLVVISICGGNIMLTILIVLALIPLGYLFVKFF
jgi:nitrate/nitrite transporter NarK